MFRRGNVCIKEAFCCLRGEEDRLKLIAHREKFLLDGGADGVFDFAHRTKAQSPACFHPVSFMLILS